ncbi:MAG: GH36-type glycosyl hydrolase domain-containing protein, partial [Acidimicrobiia bacterium]
PEGGEVVVVRAYMAHHQGMSLVALANVLLGGTVQGLFHADPSVRAVELLLQERMPHHAEVARPRAEEVTAAARVLDMVPAVARRFSSPHHPVPPTHLLSNGRYSVMLTAAGSGYSRRHDLAVTRFREDVTRDAWGAYFFLRDARSGRVWSAGYQPSGLEADSYQALFSEERAEISRRDGAVTTTMEVVVSAEDDAEVRRLTIANLGTGAREIEVTSYAEVVLTSPAADAAHPAFSNLFVQTEVVPGRDALLATRRPRSVTDAPVWAAHVVAGEVPALGGLQYETDRARFLGRGRSIRTAAAVMDGRPLSDTVGPVLDPIFSLRRRIRLPAGSSARLTFTTLLAGSREEALDLVDKYHDPTIFDRTLTLAWTQAQVQLHHLGVEPEEARAFQQLAGGLLYPDPSLRPLPEVLERNRGSQSGLWRHGISGDLPIVLVRIDQPEERRIVRDLLRAHEYWRLKGLEVDLVIINEKPGSYAQDLQATIEELVRASGSRLGHEAHRAHGSVFIVRGDQLTMEDRDLLQTAARAVLLSRHGSLADQVLRRPKPPLPEAPVSPKPAPAKPEVGGALPRPELEFWNGLGGFAADGKEYVV